MTIKKLDEEDAKLINVTGKNDIHENELMLLTQDNIPDTFDYEMTYLNNNNKIS